jgi:hypothetical protein
MWRINIMSKYVTFTEIIFPQQELLIAALKDCGYSDIEQGTDLPLKGWGNQKQVADVILRKDKIGAIYGDVGFRKTGKGYVPVIDDIDLKRIHNGRFLPALRTAYYERAAAALAVKVHGSMSRKVEGNKIKIVIRRP